MTVYVVDTNFFIQAHRSYYPLDVVPTFWRRVRDLAEEGKIAFALALSTKRTIVTYEKSAPGIRHTIKIPEACNAFNISFLDPMTMLRTLGVTI